ncbi:hypothetical protein B7486_28035 [cyanobacterium TDX16]|nr:hypothetical protein B7486_28035 [cyanobacterium TDX16]
MASANLEAFLTEQLGIAAATYGKTNARISTKYFALPTASDRPLSSPELARYLDDIDPENEGFAYWAIACYLVNTSVKTNSYSYSQREFDG